MTTKQHKLAFRGVFEDRLAKVEMPKTQTPPRRLRKLVVFDRFLARLVQLESGTSHLERWPGAETHA